MWKTQGTQIQPWRSDVVYGAIHKGDSIIVQIESKTPWKGQLILDKPRHKEVISHEAIRRVFKKNEIKPWQRKGWVIPPEVSGSFVADMAKVLDGYKRPLDPRYPVVCMDESPKQLIGETKIPIPASPEQPAKYVHEYKRSGEILRWPAVHYYPVMLVHPV